MRASIRFTTTFILLFLAARLHAADAPLLPASAVSEHTITIGYIDVTSVTMNDLQSAIKAILGDQAALFDEQLKQPRQWRDGFIKAGGKSLAIALNMGEQANDDPPIVIITPVKGADPAALQAWFTGQLPRNAKLSQWTQSDGHWLLTQSGYTLPAPSPMRYAQLTEQLNKLDGQVKVLAVPTDALRQHYADVAKAMEQNQARIPPTMMTWMTLSRAMANARWLTMSATLGDKPSLNTQIQMPDETQAQQMAQIWSGLAAISAQMIVAQAGQSGNEPPDPMALMQAMAMKQNGAMLTMTLDTPTMAMLAKPVVPSLLAARAAAKRAVAMSQMLQLGLGMMMYAQDHDGQWPDQLDQLTTHMGGTEQFKKLMTHPTTGANPGFIYVKPAATITQVTAPATTVVLYEAGPDGKANPNGIRGYADGHVDATPPSAPPAAPAQ